MKSALATKVSVIRVNFIFMGVLMGGWSTRIPELKNALKMSDATLGRTLIGASLGALISSLNSRQINSGFRYQASFFLRRLNFSSWLLTYCLCAKPLLCLPWNFLLCNWIPVSDNPLTIITQEMEAQNDRKYLSGFHAFWSIGTLAAAFFGSFLIGRVNYSIHLTGLAIIVFVILINSSRYMENKVPSDESAPTAEIPWASYLGKFTVFIGIGLMFSNGAEFGATDWSALFKRYFGN
jgi:predicted MFS family arabinose efflux permease